MNTKDNTIPLVDNTYNFFDDGKIRQSRLDKVIISQVIPFSDIDKETLELWLIESEHCNWLYAKETDYFIKGYLIESDKNLIFARTKNNGWFSFNDNLWDGRLDIDGSLTDILNNIYETT